MKWFHHDTDVLRNRKMRKAIRSHGATAYAVYFALLEYIYAEEGEFRILADELWLENLAEDLKIADYRVLIRILDTFAEIHLIDRQMWEGEHSIFIQAVVERGDSYLIKRAKETEKKRMQRAKKAAVSPGDKTGTEGQNGVLSPTDPDAKKDQDPEDPRDLSYSPDPLPVFVGTKTGNDRSLPAKMSKPIATRTEHPDPEVAKADPFQLEPETYPVKHEIELAGQNVPPPPIAALFDEDDLVSEPSESFGGVRQVLFEGLKSAEVGDDGLMAIERVDALDKDWRSRYDTNRGKGKSKQVLNQRELSDAEYRAFLVFYNQVKPELWAEIAVFTKDGKPRRTSKVRKKAVQDWFERFGEHAIAMLAFSCWCCKSIDLYSNRTHKDKPGVYEFNLDWLLGQERTQVSEWIERRIDRLMSESVRADEILTFAEQAQAYIDSLPDEDEDEIPVEATAA